MDFESYSGIDMKPATPGEVLEHIGRPHEGYRPHSGRYPWGSGEDAYQRSVDFNSHVQSLKAKGWTNKEIAQADGMTIKELVGRLSNAQAAIRRADIAEARHLREKGWSRSAVARKMGVNESSIREWEKKEIQDRKDEALNTANMLADQVTQYGYVEVGKGINRYLGVSNTKLDYALLSLKDSGKYEVQEIYVEQNGSHKPTRIQVLTRAGVPKKEIYEHKSQIAIPGEGVYTEDSGHTWEKIKAPVHISSSRVFINYTSDDGESGGVEKDGVIEIRPGVPDLSLGKASYAQVRIAVDKDRYMKGVAVYSDKVPEGYDCIYNTNKTRSQASKVFKEMAKDKDGNIDKINPFGATIKTDDDPGSPNRDLFLCQRYYTDPKTGKRKQSALNIVNEEGNWHDWGRTLSSQFLSKQSLELARRQLKIAYDRKVDEFKEIMGLTNPTIRASLLEGFADDCDSSAVHLKAAAIPGSASHLIVPINSLKDNEIYAPGYENGSKVVIIRYPYGGNFEAAELVVNNNNREGRKVIGPHAPDAVGINHNVIVNGKLSGADFDGDTVTVIPNDSGDVKVAKALEGLRNYEPKVLYAKPDVAVRTGKPDKTKGETLYDSNGKKLFDNFDTQRQMGEISNLITDMTLRKAPWPEIERAVKHSMTVIDAAKHNLDWEQSFKDNGIKELKIRYQGVNQRGQPHGASTLISMAKSQVRDVPERRKGAWIVDPETGKGRRVPYDPETGEALFENTGKTHIKWKRNSDGTVTSKELPNLITLTKMYMAKDAYELSSGTAMESVYADHANRLKSLGNRARKEYMHTEDIPFNKAAAEKYSDEISSLKAKYNRVMKNKPLERRALALMNSLFEMKVADDPTLNADSDRKKKERARLMDYARKCVGSERKKVLIKFSDKEYEAIQAGAIHKSFLQDLIKECDLDSLKQQAMPREWNGLSPAKLAKARSMLNNGSTQTEVAQAMGISTTALYNALKEE